MTRSLLQIIPQRLLLFLLVFVHCFVLPLPVAAEEAGSNEQQTSGEKSTDSESSAGSSTTERTEAEQVEEYSAGVFFGHLLVVDPDKKFLFVKPTDGNFARKYFYLDRKTRYTFVIEGRRKRRSFSHILEGQKVAIRYFSRGKLAIADEVFVVFGEFRKGSYDKIKRRGKSSAGKKGAKGGGGKGH